jgi:hypothetical protein
MPTAEDSTAPRDHARAFGSSDAFFEALSSCEFAANAGCPYGRPRTRAASLDDVLAAAAEYRPDVAGRLEICKELCEAAAAVEPGRRPQDVFQLLYCPALTPAEVPRALQYADRLGRIEQDQRRRSGHSIPEGVRPLVGTVLIAVAELIDVGELERFPMLRLAAEAVLDGHIPGDIERATESDTLQVH